MLRILTWNLVVLVEIDWVMFLHLSCFLYFYSTFLSWLLQIVQLLLDLINSIVCHRTGGIHSELKVKCEIVSWITLSDVHPPLRLSGPGASPSLDTAELFGKDWGDCVRTVAEKYLILSGAVLIFKAICQYQLGKLYTLYFRYDIRKRNVIFIFI